MTTDRKQRFRVVLGGYLSDVQSRTSDFDANEAHKSLLEKSISDGDVQAEIDKHCVNYSLGLDQRAVGCWQRALYQPVRNHWLDHNVDYIGRIVTLPDQVVTRFGEQVSEAREADIIAMLNRIAVAPYTQVMAEFDSFAATLDDVNIESNCRELTIQIGTELPRMLFLNNDVRFDAPDGLTVTAVNPDTGQTNLFTLTIPTNWKARIDMVSYDNANMETGRENIESAAKGTYTMSTADWNTFYAKLSGTVQLEMRFTDQ